MELDLDDSFEDKIDLNEKKNYAKDITDSIRILVLHLNDKSFRCRYSPHLINASMAVYTKSKRSYGSLK